MAKRNQPSKNGPANLPVANRGPAAVAEGTIIDRLSGAIVEAFRARGSVAIEDGTQAGLSQAEVKQHWDAAMTRARAAEPRLVAA